jgi:hypothetical protein
MAEFEYGLLHRAEAPPEGVPAWGPWDVLLSAFNRSARVNGAFEKIQATEKHWLIHVEYDFPSGDLPATGQLFKIPTRDEAELLHQYLSESGLDKARTDTRICVDITGFMRPHLMLLPRLVRDLGFSRLDVIYSDPLGYESGDKTPFTQGAVTIVRQVRGFEGVHLPDAAEDDLLVIGAGYDDELIRRVAEDKRAARKVEMFGLPSLQPHMYEENQLRAARADESVGPLPVKSQWFAPANNPFATAQELRDRIGEERERGIANLYMSPLATKPQALGFALYYLCECAGGPTSIIFPYAEYYSQETSKGWARTSLYRLELDWFAP